MDGGIRFSLEGPGSRFQKTLPGRKQGSSGHTGIGGRLEAEAQLERPPVLSFLAIKR